MFMQGGIPFETTEEQVKDIFTHYGAVSDVVLMYDRDTRRPRGFGFVTFESEASVDSLCADHYVKIGEKQVEIKRAEPKAAMDGSMRGSFRY